MHKWANVGWFVFKWFSLSSYAVMRKGVRIKEEQRFKTWTLIYTILLPTGNTGILQLRSSHSHLSL